MTSTYELNQPIDNYDEGTPCEPSTIQNMYQITGTWLFINEQFVRETVQPATLTEQCPTGYYLSQNQREQLQEIIATTDFPKYGEKYRYYTLTTNRWDLATFEKTGTDIGRFMSGFAIKVPSGKTAKRERLRLLNSILGLWLSEEAIHASVIN